MSDEQMRQTEPKRRGRPRASGEGEPQPAVKMMTNFSLEEPGAITVAPGWMARDTESGPKPAVKVTSRRNAALARRLAPGGNPHATGSKAIPIKEPSRWQLYIGNDYNGADDLYRMVHEYGWTPLAPEDLACKPEDIGYRVNESGHLVRGPQGREVIFKMDKADYRELVKAKTERNLQGIGSASKTRHQVATAAGNAFGDEAGEFVHRHIKGTVTDTQEPVI